MKRKYSIRKGKKYEKERKGFRLNNSRTVQKGGNWGRKRGVVVEWVVVLNGNSMDSVLTYITSELYDNKQVMSQFYILYLMPVVLYYPSHFVIKAKK